MQPSQTIEAYVELNLDLEAEEAKRGSYPQEISIKLFKLLETMTSTQIKEGEALLSRVREARGLGNL